MKIYFELSVQLEILAGAATPVANWPSTLPQQWLARGFQYSSEGFAVRTAVDQGPPFQRPRYSVPAEVFAASIVVTKTQLDTFWTWYHSDLASGAMPFNHTHPLTGDPAVLRFNVTQEPKSQALAT